MGAGGVGSDVADSIRRTVMALGSRAFYVVLRVALSIGLSVAAVNVVVVPAQSLIKSKRQSAPIDLLKIRDIAPKGRIQDSEYNSHLQVEINALVAQGPTAIDFLIAQLTDQRVINHHVLDYWPIVRVGDVALIVLADLFTDATWTQSTIPGASLDEILEQRNRSVATQKAHADFVRRHGRKAIQRKWQTLWRRYRTQVSWDEKNRCFRPNVAERKTAWRSTGLMVAE
jgi:hypothetical protein